MFQEENISITISPQGRRLTEDQTLTDLVQLIHRTVIDQDHAPDPLLKLKEY